MLNTPKNSIIESDESQKCIEISFFRFHKLLTD